MNTPISAPNSHHIQLESNVFEAAYQKVLPDLLAVDPNAFKPVSVDISKATTTVLQVTDTLGRAGPSFFVELATFDFALVGRLTDYAHATKQAHAAFSAARTPPDELPGLHEEAVRLRELLAAELSLLMKRGLIPHGPGALRGPAGYHNLAHELQSLRTVFRSYLPVLEGRSGVTEAELATASALVEEISRFLTLRGRGENSVIEAADLRIRAFTLLTNTYDDVRRAVGYVRFRQGDAETIAPSLYAGRGRRKDRAPAPAADGEAGPVNR